MFEPGDIVIWWRTPRGSWGPACAVVKRDEGDVLVVDEGGTEVHIHVVTYPPEHRPRVVGRVANDGRPSWGAA